MMFTLLTLVLAVPGAQATLQHESVTVAINPIRKVVSLLQAMQKKVGEEGEKETAMYKKYMCYCSNSGGALSDGISANEGKTTTLSSDIKQAEEQKVATEEALAKAQTDRADAKTSMKEATAIREKDAAAFAAEKASYGSNIQAIVDATKAIEKGMAGAFLQTSKAQVLLKLAQTSQHMLEADREDLVSFLSGTQSSEYAPQSGEIVGILKQMGDEMGKGLAEATDAEEAAVKGYGDLMAAKTKEVEALTVSIETKMTKVGELAVSISQMKNELTDTEEALIADKDFLANLEKDCGTKTAEWEVIVATRTEELVALAETIKILNDDDSLELFKKTLPSAAASSFMQIKQTSAALRVRALAELKKAPSGRVDFIGLALRGKKIGFAKVITMIDDMVANLKAEQGDDDSKKEYCSTQFDQSDDKKKGLEKSLSDTEAAIASTEEAIATLTDEIAALLAAVKATDKSVAEATENRKAEHEDFTDLMASDSAAKELLHFAKNRLNKFYNPKLYKAPPKVELSAEDRIVVSEGGTAPPTPAPGGIAGTGITVLADVSAHMQNNVAPPPPPEAVGAYKKKSGENSGVLAMIDLLVQDLEKEMTESTTAEKDAQADYEQLMADSAAKRTADSALHTEKTSTKAALEGDLQTHRSSKAALTGELGATLEYIASLHAECDWLMQYFSVRKTARDSEIDALGNAKAVLSGADYSLLQSKSLRGSA